jgi:CubicO group peptidase (beta-lactamase class C family)
VIRLAVIGALIATMPAFILNATEPWSVAEPDQNGVDEQALTKLFADLSAEPHKDFKGIVILRHGKLLAEAYFNGDDANSLHDIRSATKSITALLMGIAIERQIIQSVDDSIAQYLPDLPRDGKERITIRDLLTMRSGLDADDDDSNSPGNESRLDESADWMKSVYDVPMKNAPGAKYVYVSINAFLAGAIIENASKLGLDQFAKKNLFAPLGIDRFEWRKAPINRTTGQGNLQITARDEARLCELVLNKGRLDGHQIVSPAWIEQCLAAKVAISTVDPYADFYGYMWYTKTEHVEGRSNVVHFASGNGGNKIYVVPSCDLVVGMTSSAYNQGYGQRRSRDALLRILSATRP